LTRAIHRQYLAPFRRRWARVEVLWALARAINGSAAHFDAIWQRRAALADIPVQLIWGMRDSAFRPTMIDRWRVAAPHASLVELPTAGHWPHEEEPTVVCNAIAATAT